MSRISVNVPDSVLGEEKAKEIASLRAKNKRLETKVKTLEAKLASGKHIVEQCKELRSLVADKMNLYEDWELDDW